MQIAPQKTGRGLSLSVIISLIISILLLMGAIGFGAWAYMSRQDYKDNVDKKVAIAVTSAKQQEGVVKDAEFAQKDKNPARTYKGPATYGGLVVMYPKTWSAFVTEGGSQTLVDGYFHPSYVPGLDSKTAFALRVRILNQSYATAAASYASSIKLGKLHAAPYAAPKVPSITGVRMEGELSTTVKNGVMILLPLRDKTIEISTQSQDFLADLNNFALANLSFEP